MFFNVSEANLYYFPIILIVRILNLQDLLQLKNKFLVIRKSDKAEY